jgi:hypothetical protein
VWDPRDVGAASDAGHAGLNAESPPPVAQLGPGCPPPGVDLSDAGIAKRGGRPVIAAVAGRPASLHVRVDADRPYLDTSATVVIAVPGTIPGQGFANLSQQASGVSTVDDQSTWKASMNVAAQAHDSAQTLRFTPTGTGTYPVYVILRSTPKVANPPSCSGIPDTGGRGENVVGWIQVST